MTRAGLLLVALATPPAFATPHASDGPSSDAIAAADAAIDAAIARGAAWLASLQRPAGDFGLAGESAASPILRTALPLWALSETAPAFLSEGRGLRAAATLFRERRDDGGIYRADGALALLESEASRAALAAFAVHGESAQVERFLALLEDFVDRRRRVTESAGPLSPPPAERAGEVLARGARLRAGDQRALEFLRGAGSTLNGGRDPDRSRVELPIARGAIARGAIARGAIARGAIARGAIARGASAPPLSAFSKLPRDDARVLAAAEELRAASVAASFDDVAQNVARNVAADDTADVRVARRFAGAALFPGSPPPGYCALLASRLLVATAPVDGESRVVNEAWRHEMAADLLSRQRADGSFEEGSFEDRSFRASPVAPVVDAADELRARADPVVETACALLALVRCRSLAPDGTQR